MRGTAIAWRREIANLLLEYAEAGALGFTEVIAENTDPPGSIPGSPSWPVTCRSCPTA